MAWHGDYSSERTSANGFSGCASLGRGNYCRRHRPAARQSESAKESAKKPSVGWITSIYQMPIALKNRP
jgi:hypothetical protein